MLARHARHCSPSTSTRPRPIAGPCDVVAASGGPAFPAEPVTTDVVVGIDDDTSGSTTDGCSTFEQPRRHRRQLGLRRREPRRRRVLLHQPGPDSAEDAGALGIIVGPTRPTLRGTCPAPPSTSTRCRSTVTPRPGSRTVGTVHGRGQRHRPRRTPAAAGSSARSDPAFGGAIRDMWNPTCYGDPGKVSDAEYHCDTDDSGGVHTNSGVVEPRLRAPGRRRHLQRGDGAGDRPRQGGQPVLAHPDRRTSRRSSDFADLADGLAASCTDLIGEDINAVTLGTSETGAARPSPSPQADHRRPTATRWTPRPRRSSSTRSPTQCDFGRC